MHGKRVLSRYAPYMTQEGLFTVDRQSHIHLIRQHKATDNEMRVIVNNSTFAMLLEAPSSITE